MPSYRPHPKFNGVIWLKQPVKFYTENLDINRTVYGEKLREYKNTQIREWDPYRSKLCAAMHNRVRDNYIEKNSVILYLGASSGTTVSHISDIVTGGIIYAVEFSPRSLRELIQNSSDRKNIIPILADANRPFDYSQYILEEVDILYMDVAQPNQTEIVVQNAKTYLKKGGKLIYCVKARSIDTTEDPRKVFDRQKTILENEGFRLREEVNIAPYSEDHIVIFAQYIGN